MAKKYFKNCSKWSAAKWLKVMSEVSTIAMVVLQIMTMISNGTI